jgi:hypothetical protein
VTTLIELERAAVLDPDWEWLPGMEYRVDHPAEPTWRTYRVTRPEWVHRGVVPVTQDPATKGCLLQLIRNQFRRQYGTPGPVVWCELIAGLWHCCLEGTALGPGWTTEEEALLQTLLLKDL